MKKKSKRFKKDLKNIFFLFLVITFVFLALFVSFQSIFPPEIVNITNTTNSNITFNENVSIPEKNVSTEMTVEIPKDVVRIGRRGRIKVVE